MAAAKSFYATGRRKAAIAKVWIFPGQKGFTINGKSPENYLKRANLKMIVEQPIEATELKESVRIRTRVEGGGIAGQAGAIRLGISRALTQYNESLRSPLRRGGFLTRDPREKERKKFGRKGARRSFQFTKR